MPDCRNCRKQLAANILGCLGLGVERSADSWIYRDTLGRDVRLEGDLFIVCAPAAELANLATYLSELNEALS